MKALTPLQLRWVRALLAFALASAGAAEAQLFREAPRGEAVERHLPAEIKPDQWVLDPVRVNTDIGDRFEERAVEAEELETVKLTNLVPPIRFASGVAYGTPYSQHADTRAVLSIFLDVEDNAKRACPPAV